MNGGKNTLRNFLNFDNVLPLPYTSSLRKSIRNIRCDFIIYYCSITFIQFLLN